MPSRKHHSRISSLDAMHPKIGLFNTLMEAPNVLIVGLDTRGRIILFNKGCEKITGYTRKEVQGKSVFTRFIPQKQRKQLRQVFKELLTGEYPTRFINDWITKNGDRRTIEWTNTVLTDEYNAIKEIYSIGFDITEKIEAEKILNLQERAIAGSPNAIVITDMNFAITYVNQAFLELFSSQDREQIMGGNLLDIVRSTLEYENEIQTLISDGRYEGELVWKLSDRQLIDVKISASTIRDVVGNPTHIMVSITDVSEIKKAEAKYRSLFDSVPIGLYRTKPGAGEILDVNPALVKMLGYPDRASLLTMKAPSFYVDPSVRKRWETMIEQDGVVRGFEVKFRRLDGRIIWVRLNSRAIRDEKGKILYYEGTFEDITDMKLAQEALAESEERYRLFFENISDVILQIDPQLNIVDVSPSVETHLGYNREELIGHSFVELNLLAPEYVPQALENSRRLFLGEEVPSNEYPFIRKDGSRKWGEVTSTLITREGKVVALFSLVRDINDRKLAEIELQNINRDLQLYASLLRHDLSNDLQVIFSTTEVAQMMTAEDSEVNEFIDATRAAAERMAQLLDLFGRPDEESEKDIITLLKRCAAQAMKAHTHLTIKLKAPAAMKHTPVAGGRLLPMVFDNLFRNAAQYAGGKPKVRINVTTQENSVQINIIDDGPGIPNELRSKLFQRGVSTTGSGLGLNLSKRILEAYGGSIELLEEKRGAAFQILLPLEES